MKQFVLNLLLLLLGVVTGVSLARWPWSSRAPTESSVLTIDRLRPLAELTTLALDVADVQETRIEGHVGGISAVLLVKGEVRIATDLGKARLEKVDGAQKTAILVLDPPAVSTATLDQDHTRLYAVTEQGLWLITPGDRLYDEVVNRAFDQAQHAIADAGNRQEMLDKARRQAEIVLQGFFSALGWQVSTRWSDDTLGHGESQ